MGARAAGSNDQIIEISDLITASDPGTGLRRGVPRAEVLRQLAATGDNAGVRIAAAIEHDDGLLDAGAVDALLVRVHTELQRLSEELRMGERLVEMLRPMLAAVRASENEPIRIVDVGCGLGYTTRWLASTGALGSAVRLTGVDLNAALVEEAARLATVERLDCEFLHADALDPSVSGDIMTSSGLLHHLRGPTLDQFFARHDQAAVRAFCHFDIAATRLAPLGAWLFHRARMREPLGRHDGVASAKRAHSDDVLLAAARRAAGFQVALHEPAGHNSIFCATVRPVLGIREPGMALLRARLGRCAGALAADSGPAKAAVAMPSFLFPAFLVAVMMLDAALAGFRAAAGRSGLIRKVRYNLIAAARGAGCGCVLLLGLGAGLGWYLAASSHRAAAFATLLAAGRRMSAVYLPYTAIVLASLAGYFTLPLRASSWTIVAGLGPLTLLRPVVAVAGGLAAVWHANGLAVPVTAAAAVAAVLSIEPVVHRRWYS